MNPVYIEKLCSYRRHLDKDIKTFLDVYPFLSILIRRQGRTFSILNTKLTECLLFFDMYAMQTTQPIVSHFLGKFHISVEKLGVYNI